MSFTRFAESILSPDLRAVALHWNNARTERRMPSWDNLQPAAMARQLPIVWSYDYDVADDDFVGRLSGEAMKRIFGKNIKGTRLSQLDSIIDSQRFSIQARRVMREPALVRLFGPMYVEREKIGMGECIIMPLGADGNTGDAILGATDCRLRGHMSPEMERVTEAEAWWSVEQIGATNAVVRSAELQGA